MKYCKNCGMLLEDTHERCIRCGTDVTNKKNVSKYPIKVQENMEAVSEQKKKTGKIVAMIIGLVVLMAGLIAGCLYALSAGLLDFEIASHEEEEYEEEYLEEDYEEESEEDTDDELTDDISDSSEEDTQDEEAQTEETAEQEEATDDAEAAQDGERAIKDEAGKYYNIVRQYDDADNLVFTAYIPEDLTLKDFYVDYGVYSTVFPIGMSFAAYDEENSVRFTYLSPKHFWYKKSETGKSHDDAADITKYMTYCKYESPTSYIDLLIKKNYPGAKAEIINEYDFNDAVSLAIDKFASKKSKELFSDIGDYAGIGEDTKYTNMDYSASAKMYEYEVTLKDKSVLRCKYFIPSVVNNLMYACQSTNDRGTVSEWYNLGIACFETGNDDLYDRYSDDFDVFAANAFPSGVFMYANQAYAQEIEADVHQSRQVKEMTETKLKGYAVDYARDKKMDEFYSDILGMMTSLGKKSFSYGKYNVYTMDDAEVLFVDNENNKLFISPQEDEYPGESFEEYTCNLADEEAEGAEE